MLVPPISEQQKRRDEQTSQLVTQPLTCSPPFHSSLHCSVFCPFSYPHYIADRAMEPLVCVVPQSLRVLVERLPAYISFLEQQGYSVYRQISTRLSAAQAHTLYGRTQDELFSLHTPVAVLLLERERPYNAWQAVREQLDIVYGSPDRKTAMDDIYAFFAADDGEAQTATAPQQPAQPTQPTAAADHSAAKHMDAPLPPPLPPSGPPPPQSEAEDDEAMDGAFLVTASTPPMSTSPPPPPPPPPQQQPETTAAGRAALSPPPPPPPPASQFQWEEIESDAVSNIQPASASPRPSSPSDSPVAFHAAPDSPQPPFDEQRRKGKDEDDEDEQNDERRVHSVQQQQGTDYSAQPVDAAEREQQNEQLTALSPSIAPSAAAVTAAAVGVVSPLQRMSETKRASLDSTAVMASASSGSGNKGPSDLLALPARLSIKERLAALNLAQEPAQASTDSPAGPIHANGANLSKPSVAAPSAAGEERRASVSMQQKQATLTTLFAKAARLSLEKGTPINGRRTLVPPTTAAVCPFASIAALSPNGQLSLPARLPHSTASEYTLNLPCAAVLLAAAGRGMRGVIHHMTGDEDEWGQRFAVLHLDSLYLWPGTEQSDEPLLMICVSEPTVSLAYAEGVIELKGAAGGRHLMAAELPDIERWYDELTRAKIEMASEDKRKPDEAEGGSSSSSSSSRRSSLNSPLARSLAIGVMDHTDSAHFPSSSASPLSLQQQMRQMRQASNAAGVSAVRPGKEDGSRGGSRDEDGAEAGSIGSSSGAAAALLHRSLPSPWSAASAGLGLAGTAQLDDTAFLRSLLLHGALFTKYKHRRGKQRWIWCSPQLDTLYWSEEKGRKVRGQLSTASITGVADGCVGVKRKGVGLTIVAEDRTLDLEARDDEQQKDWLRAVGLLINLNRQ